MHTTGQETAIIIGAGPAGLTAALEFCRRSSIRPIVLESSNRIGGLSCTIRYNGNRIDIGGHRFFSKSDRVMDWWMSLMPVESQAPGQGDFAIRYQNQQRTVSLANTKVSRSPAVAAVAEDRDCVLLVRPRKSRIYFMRSFFDYPLSLSADTLKRLGLLRAIRIGLSYVKSHLFQRKPEKTLEDFFINRFGRQLYRTFFKSYTEKVWGVPCKEISAAWGAQRIKGLSLLATVRHALKKILGRTSGDVGQKGTETSLIEQFLYPKFGPGQMWEETARRIQEMGGEIRTGYRASKIVTDGWRVKSLQATNCATGETENFEGDYFFSTAPVQELMRAFDVAPPHNVLEVSDGLVYRDFVTVGLLVRSLKFYDQTPQRQKADQRQLDLHPGTRRVAGAASGV